MIALIGKMVNYVMNWKPGVKSPEMPNNKRNSAQFGTGVRRLETRPSAKFRPVHFEGYRDGDGVMRIREVR